jgi:DNA-binding CsgD family transcriptional regulator/RimJ/RimL family protein N-acetyltransferase
MTPDAAPPAPVLSDGIVSLRPLGEHDVPDITLTAQDPLVARWTTIPTPYAQADAEAFVAERGGGAGPLPTWAITVLPDHRYGGTVDLRPDGSGGAEIGYMLAPWARGAGHAARALRLACAWGFSALRLEVVTWLAYAGNDASLKAARRAGFQVPEHVFRGYAVQRGERRDCWVGTMTPDDLMAAARQTEGRREFLGPDLTRRELDVLRQLARGASNRAIATELGISENTVKNHVRGILEKLQASSRSQAVVSALRLGLVSLPT